MALVHDLAECLIGDITPHDGVDKAEKYRRELVRVSRNNCSTSCLSLQEAMEHIRTLVPEKV